MEVCGGGFYRGSSVCFAGTEAGDGGRLSFYCILLLFIGFCGLIKVYILKWRRVYEK